MKPIHLEGMGLSGALLAHTLARYGVEFTWHDTDAEQNAWRASTGAIYPAGAENHGPDKHCYDVWKAWYDNGYFDEQHLERSTAFVFCTKNPPHKGDYEHEPWRATGSLRAGPPSYHLNAQTFVRATRQRFAHCRVMNNVAEFAKRNKQSIYIVTHGWGERFHHAYWGWTRLVKLEYGMNDKLVGRPSFYLRPDRFSMAYAYPVPGTAMYYAGSSIIQQKAGKLKQLEWLPKYDRWKTIFEREAQGFVKVVEEGPALTGWRPAAADEDEAWVKVRGHVVTLRPLWNSGIRHFPKQWAQVASLLGLVA